MVRLFRDHDEVLLSMSLHWHILPVVQDEEGRREEAYWEENGPDTVLFRDLGHNLNEGPLPSPRDDLECQ